ncbi:unnamed protein product [Spirodela intermedia]|uniref:Uncharacterized protein n=1 Tax=Spirodela intermedia TaxID=51605 RepID=A0A7I8JQU4_SPIIN|nr:unnamed protein product [Spirodela intermedia]CAA6671953.1 unnamed protein product [Spirodela intermedia]
MIHHERLSTSEAPRRPIPSLYTASQLSSAGATMLCACMNFWMGKLKTKVEAAAAIAGDCPSAKRIGLEKA